MDIDSDMIKTSVLPRNFHWTTIYPPLTFHTWTTWMHLDTQTLTSDSNSMTGAMAESHILKQPSIVLDCSDVQYAANCKLMDQLLWQFSFEAVHRGCYESMAFND